MRVKAIRASGNPVNPEENLKKENEWKEGFDIIVEKYGKAGPETDKALNELEKDLENRYNDLSVVGIELPKTGKGWKDLISEYGNIMLTTCIEDNKHAKTGDLLFVINDMPF